MIDFENYCENSYTISLWCSKRVQRRENDLTFWFIIKKYKIHSYVIYILWLIWHKTIYFFNEKEKSFSNNSHVVLRFNIFILIFFIFRIMKRFYTFSILILLPSYPTYTIHTIRIRSVTGTALHIYRVIGGMKRKSKLISTQFSEFLT